MIVISCSPKPEEICGDYIFEYENGAIELLSITSDMRYSFKVFNKKEDLVLGEQSIIENQGAWSIGESVFQGHKIILVNWLKVNDFSLKNKMPGKPIRYVDFKPSWFPAGTRGYKEETLWFADDSPFYFFRKIK